MQMKKQDAASNSLGSAQQEFNSREESRRVLLHAAEVLDTGPEDEFDW